MADIIVRNDWSVDDIIYILTIYKSIIEFMNSHNGWFCYSSPQHEIKKRCSNDIHEVLIEVVEVTCLGRNMCTQVPEWGKIWRTTTYKVGRNYLMTKLCRQIKFIGSCVKNLIMVHRNWTYKCTPCYLPATNKDSNLLSWREHHQIRSWTPK